MKETSQGILSISGTLSTPDKIDKVEVQSSALTKEYTDTDMINQTLFQFNKDNDISAASAIHYHINIMVFDKTGKSMSVQYHLDR